MEREDEIELARQLIAGQPQAFDRFVGHFRGKIFQYSWLMCGQREDAEEVAQEALLKVFENFHTLAEPEHVRAWVFRIAKNVCLMKRRRSLFAPTAAQEISLDELMPAKDFTGGQLRLEIADWSRVPEDQAAHAELKRTLDAAIRELPDMYRTVVLLRDVEEFSTAETAHILDVSEDVVKKRLHRARLALRKQLDQSLKGTVHGTLGAL